MNKVLLNHHGKWVFDEWNKSEINTINEKQNKIKNKGILLNKRIKAGWQGKMVDITRLWFDFFFGRSIIIIDGYLNKY